jgi:anti-sigma regulatory factor (Ser/Thr protein kinase)
MTGWRERWRKWWHKPQAAAVPTGVVWNLRVERARGSVGRLNDRLEQKLRPSVPDAVLRPLQIALDELLTNVIMHAQQASGPIELRLARSAGALDVTISYLADPFDPTVWESSPGGTSIEDSQIGGLGIPLVRALMDDFRHEYVDGHNILHLRKRC